MKNTSSLGFVALLSFFSFTAVNVVAASQSDYASLPPATAKSASAFTMINLSVEWTQQAEAYTDGEQNYVGNQTYCPGRVDRLRIKGGVIPDSTGICYHQDEIYIGYFDPKKCYIYDTSGSNNNSLQSPTGPSINTNSSLHPSPHYFKPTRMADDGHKCSGAEFSGNFMNWATMTAADEFRYATTGGARLVDTKGAKAQTLLTRAHRTDWRFVNKAISASGLKKERSTFRNSPADVTSFNDVDHLIIEGHEVNRRSNYNGQLHNTTTFYSFKNRRRVELGTYNIIVEVCNPNVGLEDNCKEYTDGVSTWYKPEGVLLENAQNIRYALMTYTAKGGNEMNGGVLRAQAKHVGFLRPLPTGGTERNPNREIDQFGRYIFNPDNAVLQDGVRNSGLLNYINSFGLGRYKNRDPVSEIFYEGLRYFRGLQPIPEYIGKSNDARYRIDLEPADKDNFPFIEQWEDPIINRCQANYMIAAGDQFAFADSNLPGNSFGALEPSVPDDFFNVTTITDKVGELEGYVGNGPSLGTARRWQPHNTFYIAGLAYHARTTDIRPDIEGKQTVKTFIVDTQEFKNRAPEGRENQLWLTAKYGGFNDLNGDGDPNDNVKGATTNEWDANKDGQPDTYTLASQPANLIAGLRAALGEIAETVNTGSAIGAASNSASGETLLVQALYQPKQTMSSGESFEWLGTVQALFLDEFGRYREDKQVDGVGDGKITDEDPAITFTSDLDTGSTFANRSRVRGQFMEATPYKTGIKPEDLHTVWSVHKQLAQLTDLTANRKYSDPVKAETGGGRYIFTSVAGDNGILQESNVVPFTQESFTSAENAVYLGLDSDESATPIEVVNYIRGVESEQFRSRKGDFNGDGKKTSWLLGDVISSSPVLDAGPLPSQRYDSLYRDSTFTAFLKKYQNARQMVYFGANDGMIRGVNAGFFDKAKNSYTTSLNSETAHPLGAEMWAYVPNSVLPHLQWLKNKDYQHNYYVDGIPQLHTVNIFGDTDPDIYPNGWGKILVVGTGFGGGKSTLNNDDKVIETHPSFIILDVTNPEVPPKLLAEISHPELGFTTSRPTLAFYRQPDTGRNYNTPLKNYWYLVMGSGPTGNSADARNSAVTQGTSDQKAKLFVFDLINKEWVNYPSAGNSVNYLQLEEQNRAFVGGLTSVDWDASPGAGYGTDAIYFGTVAGTISEPTGEIYRFVPGANGNMAAASHDKLLTRNETSLNEPVQGVPKVVSRLGEQWVFFGTGRFVGDRDLNSRSPMGFYAVREFPLASESQVYLKGTHIRSQLVNVTNIATKYESNNPGGDLIDESGSNITKSDRRFSRVIDTDKYTDDEALPLEDLELLISKRRGWFRRFDANNQRQVGRVDSINDGVFFTVYTPGSDPCEPSGQTSLMGVNYRAGISPAYSILGDVDSRGGVDAAANDTFLSSGLVKDVTLLGNLTFNEVTTVDSIDDLPADGSDPDDSTNINPGGDSGTTNGDGDSGGDSDDPSSLPNPGSGSNGGNGNPNGGAGGTNQTTTCGKGFPIASSGNGNALGSIVVRNCRRLGGRLSWREVSLPW